MNRWSWERGGVDARSKGSWWNRGLSVHGHAEHGGGINDEQLDITLHPVRGTITATALVQRLECRHFYPPCLTGILVKA